ncbi:MAG: GxxExxY protein [Cocleimonas sp.]|nr:GxxExxY protein [Cocleimonas sp.]
MEFDNLSHTVLGCAIEVHKHLGPGLLESTYEQCLAHELQSQKIDFKIQHPLAVEYKGIKLDCGYRIDLLIEDELIIELKSVEKLKRIHEAQLLTYMKLAKIKTGLLINFNEVRLKDGIKRFVL